MIKIVLIRIGNRVIESAIHDLKAREIDVLKVLKLHELLRATINRKFHE